jgi:hypothetical protein
MERKLRLSLCLPVLATISSALAQDRPPDGTFQLPYVCITHSTLVRFHALVEKMVQSRDFTQSKEAKEYADLLRKRDCIAVQNGTLFRIVQRTNGAMQIELISVPYKSLGLYWGSTQSISKHLH